MPDYILETERLFLRKLKKTDFLPVSLILKDIDVMYAWEHGFSDEEVTSFIDNDIAGYEKYGYSHWAVIEKKSNNLIGLCGLISETADNKKYTGIGYIFNKKYWGKGYAFESASACIDYGFNVLNLKEITAQIRPENTPSINLAEKLGMKPKFQFVKKYRGKDMVHILYCKTV